jgi:2'-5' RNA ligase
MIDGRRSGLVVPMPELEATVGPLRAEWDPLARLGARAHVTVLFPFATPTDVDDALLDRVRGVVAGHRPHSVRFSSLAEFPDHVLYLEPEPAEPFQDLTRALAAEFPEYPPYRGQFVDIIPHLTVAHDPAAPNRRLRAELAPFLPVTTTADRVELWAEGDDDRWTARERFGMARVGRGAQRLSNTTPAASRSQVVAVTPSSRSSYLRTRPTGLRGRSVRNSM